MTLPTSDRVSEIYTTNGAQKDFSFGFRVFYDPENGGYGLEVRRQTETGYEVIPKSQYDVIPSGDSSSGIIRFYTAPAAGLNIYIAGFTKAIQQLDLTNYGRYSAESIETQFDYITAIIQEWLSSLGEETRQRIAADEILNQYVVQRIDDFVQQVNQNWDDKSQEIEDYIATIMPSFTQTLREEIEAFAVAGMQDAIDQTLSESKEEIDDAVARANAAALAAAITGNVYDTPEAGVDPVTGVGNGAYYNVRSTDDDSFLVEYQNIGGVPTPSGKSYPSYAYVQSVSERVDDVSLYTAQPFMPGKTYLLNERVQLDSGEIVKSIVTGNTNNPNDDMTGWIKTTDPTLIHYNDHRMQDDKNKEFLSITDYKNRAVGDYWTDAFNQAIYDAQRWGIKEVIVPNTAKYYKVKNIEVPLGIDFRGLGRRRVYNPTSLSQIEGHCFIVFDETGDYCFNFGGYNTVINLNFHGTNRSCYGLGVGEKSGLIFRDVSIIAFDGGFASSGGYIRGGYFSNIHATRNNVGVRNAIDTQFDCGVINDNLQVGIGQGAGANDCNFVGVKNEWNVTNWAFYQNVNNVISGGVTDRARDKYNFEVKQSVLTINGHMSRRSGAANLTDSAHFLLQNNTALSLNGFMTRTGANDGGSGNTTPAYIFDVEGSTSGELSWSGGDARGYTVAVSRGNLNARYSNVIGVADTLYNYGGYTGTVSAGNTLAVEVIDTKVNLTAQTVNTVLYKVFVTSRSSTGVLASNEFTVRVARPFGSGATATIIEVKDGSSTAINTTGGSINVSINTVDTVGKSFNVLLTNSSDVDMQVSVKTHLVA